MSRSLFMAMACALVIAVPAQAQTQRQEDFVALELDEAAQLALQRQPLLQAQEAYVRAADESAAAASALPDPQLTLGIQDVPVTGAEAYRVDRNSDSQFMLGLSQELPAPGKRRLRGERERHEAMRRGSELEDLRRQVRRDASLAWLDAWRYDRARELARAAESEANLQAQAVEIAYQANRASEADVLAARVERALRADEAANFAQSLSHAQNTLSRWIGEDAFRPICPDLPQWAPPPARAELLASLSRHPHLQTQQQQAAVAEADVALAERDYRPDWRVMLEYGHRPDFSEMVTLQVGVDLPLFTHHRQDRRLAARRAELIRAEELAADAGRMHAADARLNLDDWILLGDRLRRYDESVLPDSERRIEAARLSWQSGKGSLMAVLDARSRALEMRMKKLELELDRARHRVQLEYFLGAGHD